MPDPQNHDTTLLSQVEITSQLPQWDEFLTEHPGHTIYHHPAWGQIMHQAYGNQPFYLTARCGGKITGILQLVEQKSALFGHHLCSLPYFDASGILAHQEQAASAILEKSRQLLQQQNADWIELRHLQPMGQSIPVRTDKITMQLPLPPDEETLWQDFSTKVRNKVRKVQQANLQVKEGGLELLDDFYDVYSLNMRDLGSPPHSRRFFYLILEAFPAQIKLFSVYLDGQAVAASFTLTDAKAFRVPWSGTHWRFKNLNTNMQLYWSMLAYAARIKAPCFDFGRSTLDSGTHMFKKQWGAKEVPLYWQFLLADGQTLPNLTPDSQKFRLIVACWKKLPISLVRCLGPRLIRKLS